MTLARNLAYQLDAVWNQERYPEPASVHARIAELAESLVVNLDLPLDLEVTLSRSLALAQDQIRTQGRNRVRDPAFLKISTTLLRLSFCAEAYLLRGKGDAGLTDGSIRDALEAVTDSTWLVGRDADRLRREIGECRELGLLPTEPLESALSGKIDLPPEVTFDAVFGAIRDDIEAWGASFESSQSPRSPA